MKEGDSFGFSGDILLINHKAVGKVIDFDEATNTITWRGFSLWQRFIRRLRDECLA